MMKQKLTIIGGGITGLAAAYIASKKGWDVTVIESAPEMGGLLNTFPIGGTRLEFYYHHFFTHDAEINWLCKELGIEDRVMFRKTSMGVFRNKKIYDFNSPKDLFTFDPISLFDKFRFGLTSLYLGKVANWRKMENVSALEWFYKYAGRTTTDSLWKPLLDVKFGPYAQDVPVSWMVGRLAQRMNSRKKTEEMLGYVEGSLSVLLEHLLVALKNQKVKLVTDAKVTDVVIKSGELVGIKTTKGIFRNGKFLATIPTIFLAPLLKQYNQTYAKKL